MPSSTLQFHEAAELFPLDEEHIDELATDIKANRQQVPIELCNGKVIDGRRRYTACQRIGVTPKFMDVSPTDPVAYVMSLNLHRRHLTPSQRAMVAGRAREIYDRQAKERQKEAGVTYHKGTPKEVVTLPQPLNGKSRDVAGKAASVSGTYVDRATKVLEKGTPELIKAVDEGRIAVTTAAILSSEPPEVQREECAKPKRVRTYNSVSVAVSPAAEMEEPPTKGTPKVIGVGIAHANEAINCLTRIPKNDALRKRGFQLVTDWIRHNQ